MGNTVCKKTHRTEKKPTKYTLGNKYRQVCYEAV